MTAALAEGNPSKKVAVTCRRCGKASEHFPGAYARLKTLEIRDGQPTILCRGCHGRGALRAGTARLLADYGVTNPADPARKAALARHMRAAVDKAGGRAVLIERANAAKRGGISEQGRRRRSLHQFVSTKRRQGEFRRCPLCRKLAYLVPSRLQDGSLGFHGGCYRRWMESPEYQAWAAKLGPVGDPMRPLRLRQEPRPLPPAPRGRPTTPAELERHFRWTVRHFGLGESWREIAAADGFGISVVRGGVFSLIKALPDTWAEAYGGKETGRKLDELLPVEQLRRVAALQTS